MVVGTSEDFSPYYKLHIFAELDLARVLARSSSFNNGEN
jgi:hypothetical protein